jgi:AcrR family transcriptional regulator
MSVLNKKQKSAPIFPVRRDVLRHRAALLDAAARIFAESGMDAPLGDIALAAGVGRTTLHRHFPERIDIVVALLNRNLDALETLATESAGDSDCLLKLIAAMIDQDVDVAPLLDNDLIMPTTLLARFVKICTEPLEAARRAGIVRTDLSETDLLDLTVMAGSSLKRWGLEQRRIRAPRIQALLFEGILRTRL